MALPLWFKAADTGDKDFIKRNIYQFEGYKDSYGNTALMRACMADQHGIVQLLQQEMTQRNEYNRTALMLAVFSSQSYLLIPHLLREIRFRDAAGQTALMIAAQRGNLTAVKLLKDHEYGEKDNKGRTALMHAAAHGYLAIVKELAPLERGVYDTNKMTALMFAAGAGHLDICQELVQFEAGCRNVMDETALNIAQIKGKSYIVYFLQQHEMVQGSASVYSSVAGLNERERNSMQEYLRVAKERQYRYSQLQDYNKQYEDIGKVSGDLLALNLRLQQVEVGIYYLRNTTVDGLTESKLNILDKRIYELEGQIGKSHESCYDMAYKSKYGVQNVYYAYAELQAQLDESKSQTKLLAQYLQFLKSRIDGTSFYPHDMDSNEYLLRNQAMLTDKCTKIDMLEQLAVTQSETIYRLERRLEQLEREKTRPGQASQYFGNEREEMSKMKAKLYENLDLMGQIINQHYSVGDDNIVYEIGKLKIDFLALQHQQYISDSCGLDGRVYVIESTLKGLQDFVYNALGKVVQ